MVLGDKMVDKFQEQKLEGSCDKNFDIKSEQQPPVSLKENLDVSIQDGHLSVSHDNILEELRMDGHTSATSGSFERKVIPEFFQTPEILNSSEEVGSKNLKMGTRISEESKDFIKEKQENLAESNLSPCDIDQSEFHVDTKSNSELPSNVREYGGLETSHHILEERERHKNVSEHGLLETKHKKSEDVSELAESAPKRKVSILKMPTPDNGFIGDTRDNLENSRAITFKLPDQYQDRGNGSRFVVEGVTLSETDDHALIDSELLRDAKSNANLNATSDSQDNMSEDNAILTIRDNATCKDNATLDNAITTLRDNATSVPKDDATSVLKDNATIGPKDNATSGQKDNATSVPKDDATSELQYHFFPDPENLVEQESKKQKRTRKHSWSKPKNKMDATLKPDGLDPPRERASTYSEGHKTSKEWRQRLDSFRSKLKSKFSRGHSDKKSSHDESDETQDGDQQNKGSGRESDPSIWYVDTESNPSLPVVTKLTTSSPELENHGTGSTNEKKAAPKTKPKHTIEYEVKLNDTLASIAAQFDTTPSELMKLNKLVMRTVFPSQVLFVPDGTAVQSEEESTSPPPLVSPQEKMKFDVPLVKMADKPPAKVPGHAQRTSVPSPPAEPSPPHKLSEVEAEQIDKECHERFIKINVKHITDGQGVVSGTLLVTPNAVMFDPNVSDPLVIEHGAEKYGMITPMDMVMSAAMYHDIAAMKLRGQKSSETSKPLVYHADDCPLYHHKHHNNSLDHPDHSHNELSTDMDSMRPSRSTTVDSLRSEVESMCSCGALSRDTSVHDIHGNSKPTETTPSNISNVISFDEESQYSLMRDPEYVSQNSDSFSDSVFVEKSSEKKDEIIPNVLDYSEAFEDDSIINSVEKSVDITTSDKFGNTAESDKSGNSAESDQSGNRAESDQSGNPAESDQSGNPAESDKSGENATSDNTGDNAKSDNSGKSDQSKDLIQSHDTKMDPIQPTEAETADKNSKDTQDHGLDSVDTSAKLAGVNSGNVDKNESESQIGNISYFPIEENAEGDLVVKGNDDKMADAKLTVNTNIDEVPAAPFSPLQTSAKHLNNFVNYATGLFRISSEDQLVKDVHEMDPKKSETKAEESKQTILIKGDKACEVENAIKLADKPDLFQNLDKLIPKPSSGFDDPPLYLCLRVGQPKYKEVSQTCPIESYRGNKKKPEYWFSIPRDKVDQLYAFFVQWTPDIYGDDEEMDPEQRGFVVFDEEDIEDEAQIEIVEEHYASIQKIRKDWEIVSKVEAIRRMSTIDIEDSLPLPDLIGTTTILTNDDQIHQLSNALPPRTIGYPWTLVYSSEEHGFSLKTLYRNMHGVDSPVLIVVQDTSGHVFGAVTNCALKMSDHFYGTGESFLYTFYPDFKIFHWSGENNFFIKGNQESLAIGAGQGLFGLWFDGDLYHGRSHRCDTFDNDILTEQEDFCVKAFEAWAFV